MSPNSTGWPTPKMPWNGLHLSVGKQVGQRSRPEASRIVEIEAERDRLQAMKEDFEHVADRGFAHGHGPDHRMWTLSRVGEAERRDRFDRYTGLNGAQEVGHRVRVGSCPLTRPLRQVRVSY
jgi:hypothetical protein